MRAPHQLLRHLGSLLLSLYVTSSTDLPVTSFPVPVGLGVAPLVTKRDVDYASWAHVDVRRPDPARYSERIDISLVESATSWLKVRWKLESQNLNLDDSKDDAAATTDNNASGDKNDDDNDDDDDQSDPGSSDAVLLFTRLHCHHGNITTFYLVPNDTRQYRIPNLSSNTHYVVCVEMLEWARAAPDLNPANPPSSPSSDRQKILHVRCARFHTIPLVRPDSILGLLLTLGYILAMGMIGYVTWWLRVRRHASAGSGSQKYENEMELSCRTSTIRFSEIEERAHLNSSDQARTGVKL